MSSKDHVNLQVPVPNNLKRPHHDEPPSTTEDTHHSQALPSLTKRHKTADWPLKNDTSLEANNSAPNVRDPAKSSPPQRKRKSKKSTRPSKFTEGSLNDKPSKEPPPSYIGEEEAMEDYTRSQETGGSSPSMIDEAGTEPAKSSSMFRFGKVIANVLNPVTMWQGFNGIWKEKEHPVPQKVDEPLDRNEEINKAYAALKHGGFQGMKTTNTQGNIADPVRVLSEGDQDSKRNSFRDSAIDMEESQVTRPSQDTKRSSRLTVPAVPNNSRSVSPLSEVGSERRSIAHLRTPSFHDLKKVKSHIQLPSVGRRASAAPIIRNVNRDIASNAETASVGAGLRRQPSKKDIARHNKLNKRVSDLEMKLETARQELKQSLLDAPPLPDLPTNVVRKQFVPGALGSLPSERLLAKHVKSETRDSVDVFSGNLSKVTSNDSQPTKDATPTNDAPSWLNIEPENLGGRSQSQTSTSNNRTSFRKSIPNEDFTAPRPADIRKRALPKLPSRTPHNSPNHNREDMPPLPIPGLIFDLARINQAEIISMRVIPDRHLPFGKATDDIDNLRKAHPSITDQQLAEYMATLKTANKSKTDYTSVQHANRPPSPFLGRPQAISPIKTRSRAQKRGISPPPPSVVSTKKHKEDRGSKDDDGDCSPVLGQKHGGAQRKVLGSSKQAGNAVKEHVDKPLPGIEKEDYQWDADIF